MFWERTHFSNIFLSHSHILFCQENTSQHKQEQKCFILGTLYLSSVYYTVIRAYDECMSNVVLNAKLPVSTFKHFYCIHKYQNQHLLSWYNMKINCIFQEVINKSVAKLYVYYGNLLLHWNMSRTLRNNKLVNRPFVKTAQIIM